MATIKRVNRVNRVSVAAVVAAAIVVIASPAWGLRKNPTWGIQTTIAPDAQAAGWYINLGITGARGKIEAGTPTVIEVTYVFPDTPASGRLEVGDRIVGANGSAFTTPHKFGYGMDAFGYEGPMMDLGNALERTQGDITLVGILSLDVMRGDRREKIALPIGRTYGAFSRTYPFDCAKTRRILDETRAYLAGRQGADGHWHKGRVHIDTFAALALLASGEERYRPHAERAARAFAAATNDTIDYRGLDCWKYTLYGTYLAEYYLATKEAWVLPELAEIDRWLRQAQMDNGGFGHRPANRPGGNGYGAFCAMTSQAQLAWALMKRCGIEIDDARYQATSEFVVKGTNEVGYVWYKDQSGHPTNHADMGRTGTSALAHIMGSDGDDEFGRIARANAECIGKNPTTFPDTHGSPLLGMAFTALGANASPEALRALLDHNRWHFALAHCPDGTFYYQPNRDSNPQDYAAAPRLSATAATALILSIETGNLAITRRPQPAKTASAARANPGRAAATAAAIIPVSSRRTPR